MTMYTARVWINDGPDRFFDDDPVNGHFVEGEFVVPGDTPEDALEALWTIGNKMGDDALGREYPRTERSLSVGDAALIGDDRWAVLNAGWGRVPPVREPQ